MRIKCYGDGSAVNRMRSLDDLIEKGLMTDVHTVKISDGNDSPLKWVVNAVKILNVLHVVLFRNPIICLTSNAKRYK
jgi:predicted methyltransferase